MDAIAWLQRDLGEPARVALGDWLPAGALRLTLGSAAGLAQSLLTSERILPLRDWDYTALSAATAAPEVPGAETEEIEPQAEAGRNPPTFH